MISAVHRYSFCNVEQVLCQSWQTAEADSLNFKERSPVLIDVSVLDRCSVGEHLDYSLLYHPGQVEPRNIEASVIPQPLQPK